MNCKPGDIAMAISGPQTGKAFSVIAAAPAGVEFNLPNGVRHEAVGSERWVVESLSGGIATGTLDGPKVTQGVAPDSKLMPIGDIDAEVQCRREQLVA